MLSGRDLTAETGSWRPVSRASRSRCPWQDSNLRPWLRRAVLYPVSYGGSGISDVSKAAPAPAGPAASVRGMSLGRVLVVDDDDVIRQLITINLELEGFEVTTAVDGQDCLDKAAAAHPVVITLDVMMPRLDGGEAASRRRAGHGDRRHQGGAALRSRAGG